MGGLLAGGPPQMVGRPCSKHWLRAAGLGAEGLLVAWRWTA